ncbi:MAG: flagellar biosynthesis protein FliQ [Solirubrobacteraceae bacterium]
MNQDIVVSIVTQAMEVGLKVALPVLLVGLVIGLVISVLQAVTQIQEQTLSFIPKILGLVVVIVVAGPWMLEEIVGWTVELYGSIPDRVGT